MPLGMLDPDHVTEFPMHPARLMLTVIGFTLLTASAVRSDATADRYRRAASLITVDQSELLSRYDGVLRVAIRVPPQVQLAINELEKPIQLILRASKSRTCDWEIDFSDGFQTDMSNLSELRQCARLIQQDMLRHIRLADRKAVADRLIGLYRMPRHVGPDLLLTSLVSASMLHLASESLREAAAHGMIDAAQASRILAAVKLFDAMDPVRVRDALRAERDLTIDALLSEFDGLTADREGLSDDDLRMLAENAGLSPEHIPTLLEGSDDMIAGLERYWAQALRRSDRLSDEELTKRFEALNVRVRNGEFGVMASLLAPAIQSVTKSTAKTRTALAQDRTLLEQLIESNPTGLTHANAAVWYAKAIALTEEIGPTWSQDAAVRAAVGELVAIATAADTCRFMSPEDWSVMNETPLALEWTEQVVPWWLPSMDAFITLTLESSDRGEAQGRRADAIADLERAATIIRHLSDMPTLTSSIVAVHRCDDLLERVEAIASTGPPSMQRRRLLEALAGLSQGAGDFGLHDAADRTRRRLLVHLNELAEKNLLFACTPPTGVDDLLSALAWVRDLPPATQSMPGVEDEPPLFWPDSAAGDANTIEYIDAEAIEQTAREGAQAIEAWPLGVTVPLERVKDITTPSAEVTVGMVAARLTQLQRSLQTSLSE